MSVPENQSQPAAPLEERILRVRTPADAARVRGEASALARAHGFGPAEVTLLEQAIPECASEDMGTLEMVLLITADRGRRRVSLITRGKPGVSESSEFRIDSDGANNTISWRRFAPQSTGAVNIQKKIHLANSGV